MDIREELCEYHGDDLLFAYSMQKMIEIAAKDLSVDYDEAIEWLEYNTFGAFVGNNTPIYVNDLCEEIVN
jgi:ribosome biogenesis protein Nip4